jgi:Flp pilus assembly protein TadD
VALNAGQPSDSGAAPPIPARVGEYDLLDEIARGGMGVVYRARHRQLGRVVALKMILAGQFASTADVQRFLVEAEAAAQLDHPGIVPIYEIGEHQGQRFFAMKLVEGGSLADQFATLRSDVRAGVSLLARVAHAVQHAHERGILHRDLKPANILLDADGSPLVTDFGLAKHLAGPGQPGSGPLTQSGAIVGTPSYMAPEQAGSTRQVTTAADVYALGAILYELLTGQPPHVGPSAMDIVVRLLSGEVTAPRELNPRVNHDLEAICLKCLAAIPSQRYASAAALAADLEHWLAGEPISLRASALPTLIRSWLRDNLRSAGWTLAVGLTWGALIGAIVWLGVNQRMGQMAPLYAHLPSVPRPWFTYSPPLPSWWQPVSIVAIVVLLSMMGFATAVLVRPTTRHAAVAAGLAVGFLSAVTAFALSLGWGPLSIKTIFPIQEDLTLLGDAAFTRTGPGQPHPSDRLLARYPDLEKIPERNRGGLLAGKLMGDMLGGLITGLWWGMLLSLLICLVPAVSGTVAAWSLLKRYGRARSALLPSIELGGSVAIFAVLCGYFVIGPLLGALVPPEVGWVVAMFMAVGLAVAGIWQHWPILLRVVLHGAWIAILVVFVFQEVNFSSLESRGAQRVQSGEWQAAVEQFEKVLRRQPRYSFLRFQTAIVCLKAGDRAAYERHIRELLQQARGTSDPRIADQAAKTCLLGSDQPENLAVAADLADRAMLLRAGDSASHFFQLVRGMADYRAGKHAEAINRLRKSQEDRNPYSMSTALVFEAMALERIGKREEARSALQRADRVYDDLMTRLAASDDGPLGPSWVDVLIFQIARQEANQVVGFPKDSK